MPLLVCLEREGNIAYAATRAVCHSDSPRAVMLYIGARSYSLPNLLMARTSPVRECCHARIQELVYSSDVIGLPSAQPWRAGKGVWHTS